VAHNHWNCQTPSTGRDLNKYAGPAPRVGYAFHVVVPAGGGGTGDGPFRAGHQEPRYPLSTEKRLDTRPCLRRQGMWCSWPGT
jgi:hypothetical protein